MRLTFHGAAQTVTGSRFLLQTDKSSILVDCGLFQGKKQLRQRNWEDPDFDPKHLSAIVLTHAHIDHTGYLPRLVKRGFRGPIFCTPATKALLHLLLPDSAHLQEEEANFANRHNTSKHHPALPLYDAADAKQTLEMLQTFPRRTPTNITPDVTVTAYCAGHILGASILNLDHKGKQITFSGDIGRYNTPILPDPEPVPIGDLLICESTYGDRLHKDQDVKNELAQIINQSLQRKGPLIVPAFAVGRTQELLYWIAELEKDGAIPIVPVIVDSPMAIDATEIYREFKHDFDDEAKALEKRGVATLKTEQTAFSRSVQDSKKLNSLTMPRIIISASGMATGGRILHHLSHWLPKEETTVMFVGYQAAGTRGRDLQDLSPEVKIFGKQIQVRAQIETISGLSAHGDKNELMRWIKSCSGSPKLAKIVHGEPESSQAFAELLTSELSYNSTSAQMLETVEV